MPNDLANLFSLVGQSTPATVAAATLASLRAPQRAIWRHVVDAYAYRETEDGEGRVTGAIWEPVASCQAEPCFVQTAITDQEARQAGILLDPTGANPGAAIGAALVYLRPAVLPLRPGNVLHVRAGSLLGVVFEVLSLPEIRDWRAREIVVGARRVGEVPNAVRH